MDHGQVESKEIIYKITELCMEYVKKEVRMNTNSILFYSKYLNGEFNTSGDYL